MTQKISPPAGLASRGRRFWRSTSGEFELTTAELELLTEACRVLDNLDALAATIAELGPVVAGSQKQPVVNPALTEARGQQLVLHRLLAALALPDDQGEVLPSVQRLRASRAASVRWQGHRQDVARRLAVGTD